MKLMKAFVPIMLASLLSGCAGYWVSGNASSEAVELSETDPSKGFPYFGIESARNNHPENGTQIYNEETKWCGLTIWAIIPIPLMLPMCRSNIEVTFENGKPIRRVQNYVKGGGLLCGPFVLIPTSMDNGTTSFCSTKFH